MSDHGFICEVCCTRIAEHTIASGLHTGISARVCDICFQDVEKGAAIVGTKLGAVTKRNGGYTATLGPAVTPQGYPVVPAMTGDVCGPAPGFQCEHLIDQPAGSYCLPCGLAAARGADTLFFGIDRSAPQSLLTQEDVAKYTAEIARASKSLWPSGDLDAEDARVALERNSRSLRLGDISFRAPEKTLTPWDGETYGPTRALERDAMLDFLQSQCAQLQARANGLADAAGNHDAQMDRMWSDCREVDVENSRLRREVEKLTRALAKATKR